MAFGLVVRVLELRLKRLEFNFWPIEPCTCVCTYSPKSTNRLHTFFTEFIVIGDDQIRSSLKLSFPVSFLGNIMEPAESVKTLGVTWMLKIQ